MKYRKKAPISARDIQLLILIGIVSVAVLGTLIGADIQLSRGLSGGGGFFAPWEASRAYLFRHAPPYGASAAAAAQQQIYGRLARPGENQYLATIPFFILIAYFPVAVVSDPATARGIWMFISEAALVGTAFLTLRLIEWRPRRFFEIAFALLSVFGFYSVMALIDGGPGILLGLLYMAVLLSYSVQEDELAGALLAFTLFAWEIGFLFVLLLIWKTFYDKRWRVLAGLAMTLLVLLIVSLLIYPGWVLPFVTSTIAVWRASIGTTSSEIFVRLSPEYGARAAQATTVLLTLLLL